MIAAMEHLSPARRRLLQLLKTRAPLSTSELAELLGQTRMATQQHLTALEQGGWVQHEEHKGQVGRPKRYWQLARHREEPLFPDRHGELNLELLQAMQQTFGETGMERLLATRQQQQLQRYAASLAGITSTEDRLEALSRLRSEAGYMAEWRAEPPGWLLLEHHCPICEAAHSCQALCRYELELFRALFPRCRVERVQHLLKGALRCAYRFTPEAGHA